MMMDQDYFKSLSKFRPLHESEAAGLYARMLAGDQEARHRLIESIIQLVFKLAKPYSNARYSAEDVAEDVLPVAMKAVANWKPELGRLSTIVSTYVKNELSDTIALRSHDGIYIPNHTRKALAKGVDGEGKTPRRRRELARARAALVISSFSSLSGEDDSPTEVVEPDREATFSYCLADLRMLLRQATPIERQVFKFKCRPGEHTSYGAIGEQLGLDATECKNIFQSLLARLKADVKCRACGEKFIPSQELRLFCSEECRHVGKKVDCSYCHNEFSSLRGKKYCSDRCLMLAKKVRNGTKKHKRLLLVRGSVDEGQQNQRSPSLQAAAS